MAPSMGWIVGHDRHVRTLVAIWVGLCLAAGAAWAAPHVCAMFECGATGGWAVSAAVAAGAVGALLGARSLHAQRWRLHWRSGAWWMLPAEEPDALGAQGRALAMIDLGGWMLLRFSPDGSRCHRWFVVRRSVLGAADWHAMRAALHWPERASAGRSR
jgi:hypothetical protein